MRPLTKLLLLITFSLALGHVLDQTIVGPRPVPRYFVENDGDVLTAENDDKQLYVRRKFYLTQPAKRAWIKVLGRDQIQVFINGKLIAQQSMDGFPVSSFIDITSVLHQGINVIAVQTERLTIGRNPSISIEAAYELDDGEHFIRSDENWRYSTRFQRRGPVWWFQPEYDDRKWPFAQLKKQKLLAAIGSPPRAVTEPTCATWATPTEQFNKQSSVRRDFDLETKPREGWLRVTATCCYRLAVNGIPIDRQEDEFGTPIPATAMQRTYDLTPLLRSGRNSISFVLTSTVGQPRILVDFEATEQHGGRVRFGTNSEWMSVAGIATDWLSSKPNNPDDWKACRSEAGFVGVLPWVPNRTLGTISYPTLVLVRRFAEIVASCFLVFVVTWGAIQFASILPGLRDRNEPGRQPPVLYFALIPAILAVAVSFLATFDPRIPTEQIYNSRWLYIEILSVPVQWLALAITSGFGEWQRGLRCSRLQIGISWCCLLALMCTGFWLRFRHIYEEPLHPDEWFVYEAAMGIFKCGFPITVVHKDLPTSYVSTSEILFYGNAFVGLFTSNDILIVRLPAVCWAMLTTLLLYVMGCRVGGRTVGLTAATFYTFSHFTVQMANFGRYYSQLQFFAVCSIYFYWRTLRGSGPIHKNALFFATSSFVVMFLSWEASAIMAPGMMLAAIVYRRTQIRTILCSPTVWTAIGCVLSVIFLQFAHRTIQQIERPWYGTGMSDAQLTPMWRYQIFDPLQYFWESSWNPDSIIPAIGFLFAIVACTRSRCAKFILIAHVGTLLSLGSLLPLDLNRYAYWQVPFMTLLSSNAIYTVIYKLTTLSKERSVPTFWHLYSIGLRAGTLLTCLIVGSGMTLRLEDMQAFLTRGYRINELKFPDTEKAVNFLRANHREGDIVMATIPHVVDFYWKDHRADYWPQTKLHLQAVLDDKRTLPLHKICGTTLLPDLEALKTVFEQNDRIWLIVVPMWHSEDNLSKVSSFLLENMDVAYEDFQTLVLFRDKHHLPATQQINSQQQLNDSKANFLP